MLAALLLNQPLPVRGIIRRGEDSRPARRKIQLRAEVLSATIDIDAKVEKVEGYDYSIMAAVAMIIAME